MAHPGTMRMVPIGSRGIRQELQVLASLQGAPLDEIAMTDEVLDHSGGPATSVVVAVRTEGETEWLRCFPNAQYVGRHA